MKEDSAHSQIIKVELITKVVYSCFCRGNRKNANFPKMNERHTETPPKNNSITITISQLNSEEHDHFEPQKM